MGEFEEMGVQTNEYHNSKFATMDHKVEQDGRRMNGGDTVELFWLASHRRDRKELPLTRAGLNFPARRTGE